MREMIEFRLGAAGWNGRELFLEETYEAIHDYTKGFPRQVVRLCGMSLETVIMDGNSVVTKDIVERHGEMETKLYGTRKIRRI